MEWEEKSDGAFEVLFHGEPVARAYPDEGGWSWWVTIGVFYAEGEVKDEMVAIDQAERMIETYMSFRKADR